jgi:hypothetical protein
VTKRYFTTKIFGASVLFIMIVSTLAIGSSPNQQNTVIIQDDSMQPSMAFTHTALVEVGTAQWCYYCRLWNTNLYNIYTSGDYDFEYVELIVQDMDGYTLNNDAYKRVFYDLGGLAGWPNSWLDAGYRQVSGNDPSTFYTRIVQTGNRAVPDLDATMTLTWLGDASFSVDISIHNNEATQYNGHINAYVTELESRYTLTGGYRYHHGFLGYAFNKGITIGAGETYTDSTIWDGNDYHDTHGDDFGDISQENIQVVLGVFDGTTGYCDQTVAAVIPLADCGDVNHDDTITVSDAVYLINALLLPGAPTPDPICLADVNGDGYINVSDVVYIINYLFVPGSPDIVQDCCS